MELTGTQPIAAARDKVWSALFDPEVLKQCIPGCDSIEAAGDNQLTAKVTLRVGPVKASFSGKVKLSDIVAPESCTLSGEGQGGVAGFAKGSAKVHLAEEAPDATLLTYEAKADVGGKLAQLGGRLIDATARKLAGEFFKRFGEIVAPQSATEPEEAEATAMPEQVVAASAAPGQNIAAGTTPQQAVAATAAPRATTALATEQGWLGGLLHWLQGLFK
jgi:uncharacterized protein